MNSKYAILRRYRIGIFWLWLVIPQQAGQRVGNY